MAAQFVYRHGASGYDIHGLSNEPVLRQTLLKRLESERFDPHRAAKTSIWRWIRVDAANRALLNISLRTASSGKSVIEMRGVLLDTSECDAIQWNPFRLAAMFDDDHLWRMEHIDSAPTAVIRRHLKDRPRRGGSSLSRESLQQWQVIVNDLDELASWMDLLDGNHRKEIEVEATTDVRETGSRYYIRSRSEPAIRSSQGRQRWMPAVIVTVVALGLLLIAGVTIRNVQLERDRFEAAVAEREQLLRDRESTLDEIQSERDKMSHRHAEEREELRRQLRQVAAFGRGVELRQDILADVRRRRGHVEHYLDQAMLKEAIEAWIDLERHYGVTEERIRRIGRGVSELHTRLRELNTELRRMSDMEITEVKVAAARAEEAATSLLQILNDSPSQDAEQQ